ncbi:diaminopimelate epimerase [Psychrilyobacter atlanticus]|uniref:diaminopimelate epimerase n=1 Tax=Psychrilyobacter atlanticus TaxID=271091 RepID=UPI00040CF60E|nr:diaminopimelate epimerase [Psychrilyobacter atlanticus]
MRFEKYHGLGNDFIIVGEEEIKTTLKYSELAKNVCNRKTGLGADGLIVVSKDEDNNNEMIFYNADGSFDTMCGNGFRCFCLYLKNHNLINKGELTVRTGAGMLKAEIINNNPYMVKVNMGREDYYHESIKLSSQGELFNKKIKVENKEFNITSLFMGTTHTVVFVDDISNEFVDEYGPLINDLEFFPLDTSVNFCKIEEGKLRIKTWERGVGRTLACGTGSCASAIVAKRLNLMGNNVVVQHLLGELEIELGEEIYMIGSGVKVASGYFENRE